MRCPELIDGHQRGNGIGVFIGTNVRFGSKADIPHRSHLRPLLGAKRTSEARSHEIAERMGSGDLARSAPKLGIVRVHGLSSHGALVVGLYFGAPIIGI